MSDQVVELLQTALGSARRAGLEFLDDVGLDEVDDGFEVKVLLLGPIPQAGWPALQGLLQEHALQAGWQFSKLRYTARMLMFTASRA